MDRHAWNDRYAQADLVWTAAPNRTFASEVGALTPGTALDLAAGEGRNAIWLAPAGLDHEGRRLLRRRHDTTNLTDGDHTAIDASSSRAGSRTTAGGKGSTAP